MTALQNPFGQPIGSAVPGWTARPVPQRKVLEGRTCRLEPLDAQKHAADLHRAYSMAPDGRDWTYLFVERHDNVDDYRAYAEQCAASADPMHFAVIAKGAEHAGHAVGTMALMRIDPTHGAIEVGNIALSPLVKATPMSTEAQFLLMKYAFDELGYRRYEWKCDNFNEPSKRAAKRLGFEFEGVFRQAVVYKGRSRDTAWFAIIDRDWPALRTAFEHWLAPGNFDEQGRQRASLESFRSPGL